MAMNLYVRSIAHTGLAAITVLAVVLCLTAPSWAASMIVTNKTEQAWKAFISDSEGERHERTVTARSTESFPSMSGYYIVTVLVRRANPDATCKDCPKTKYCRFDVGEGLAQRAKPVTVDISSGGINMMNGDGGVFLSCP